MRKKRFEKIIFIILMLMPLFIFGAWLLCCVFKNINGSYDLTSFSSYEILLSFVSNNVTTGIIADAFLFFFDIFNVDTLIATPIVMYIQYVILIELLWLLFDVVVFLPRACRSIIEGVVK